MGEKGFNTGSNVRAPFMDLAKKRDASQTRWKLPVIFTDVQQYCAKFPVI